MSFSLTTQGVADQLAALYRLDDTELYMEADDIRADFKGWLMNHFTLTNEQKECINRMSANTLQAFGDMSCFALKNRLEISFEEPASPPPPGSAKFVIAENTTSLKTHANGSSNGSGRVKFKAGYEPL
jgi:hypothetical protein